MPRIGGQIVGGAHSNTHEDGGTDEISVAGLSGELADDQPVKSHGADKHTNITREIFLPALNPTHANATIAYINPFSAVNLADAVDGVSACFSMKVPDDFVSFTSVKALWLANVASGNMRWKFAARYAQAVEVRTTHVDGPAYGDTATVGAFILNVQEPANPLTLTSLAPGDYLGINLLREGNHANDTLDDEVWIVGLIFEYTANQ